MSASTDYWEQRSKQVSRLSWLKRSSVIQWLLSVRMADENFLRRRLAAQPNARVLDVACGVGKVQIAATASRTYGVDIVGFPREVAHRRGYHTVEYSPPEYRFELPESVDVIACVDLNAHVDSEIFATIMESAFSHLDPTGGRLLLIGEFDNDGVGYRLMKRFPARFQRYVLGMKHWNFLSETEFLRRFEARFPELHRVERTELVCVPPLSHFYACFLAKDVRGLVMKLLFTAGDVLLSVLNNLLRLWPAPDSAFRVGFIYERRVR